MVWGQHAHRVWEKGGRETSSPQVLKRVGHRLGDSRTAHHPVWAGKEMERGWDIPLQLQRWPQGGGRGTLERRQGLEASGGECEEGLRIQPSTTPLRELNFCQTGVLSEMTVALSRGEVENECGHF